MDEREQLCCADLGPAPLPGARSYMCSRDDDHPGAHVAEADGCRLDSWPADDAA